MSHNPLKPGQLAGKTAFVSGSSRGIGAATVGYFAEAGAKVAINFRNKEARAIKLRDQIVADGGEAIIVGADLTDYDTVVDTLLEQFDLRDIALELGHLALDVHGGPVFRLQAVCVTHLPSNTDAVDED